MSQSIKIILLSILLLTIVTWLVYADLTDNGDATIDDSTTSLTWQKSAGPRKNWSDASTYCTDSTLGGYDEWRLPSLTELLTIVDSLKDPRIDPLFDMKRGGISYWTSNEITQSSHILSARAYAVYFGNGASFDAPKQTQMRVRCVLSSISVTWQGGAVTWQGGEVVW